MIDGIKLVQNENGEFEEYDDTYDVVIHCESAEEQERAINILEDRQWVSCNDRLPEPNTWVLLSFKNNKTVAIGQRIVENDGKDNFYLKDEEVGYIPCESMNMPVNAWMPLPEPYRREEEQDHETD